MFKKLKREALGVHLQENKNTEKVATAVMPVPKKIVLFMKQHIGVPCKPAVAQGEKVMVGSLVGKAEGPGADIYSGVSGTVASIKKIKDAEGRMTEAVIIESDGLQTIAPSVIPPVVRDRESFLEAVAASGLVGLGGAGFPTAAKMKVQSQRPIDTIIINACECEPYITSDDREILENGDTVMTGIAAAQKYLDISKVIIAIERNKPEAMDYLFTLTKGDPTLTVMPLNTLYPQGAEKVLIKNTTGREVPVGGFPADVGVLMMNVTTASTIGKYIATGMPLVRRRVTVDGDAVVEAKNVDVIIGTPASDVLDFCGGCKRTVEKLISGGPMTGLTLPTVDFPISKQNNALLAFSKQKAELPDPEPCIRCGRCISACPMGLSPVEICESLEVRDVDQLGILYADACIACGVCSYVCPAKRILSPNCVKARAYYLAERSSENGTK